jgi:threonine aldolase
MITAKQVKAAINPPDFYHSPLTTLVCLENTTNKGGGAIWDINEMKAIKEVCTSNGLKFHLDGARIWNALAVTGEDPKLYGNLFDSISVCLSKGLGCPVGSVLLGSKDFIAKALRVRKVFGGGMRQAGFIAAAGIYALENNIERLTHDHAHAKQLAAALSELDFVGEILPVETNIIIFEVKGRYTATELLKALQPFNILAFTVSEHQIRFVLHLDITPAMVEETIAVLHKL